MTDPMTEPDTLRLDLGRRGYDIVIGRDLLSRAGGLMKPLLRRPRAVIVTDENVGPLYLSRLTDGLEADGIRTSAITVPAGEQSKTFAGLEDVMEQLLDQRIDRKTALVALGGGIVGDLTGFAAATALRGIDFIQVPTSLLAQVDSSVGGKTAINSRHAKNMIGAFHQPRLVLADIDTLTTLPHREVIAGYAEIVKHGLICDPAFFDWCERNGAAVVSGDPAIRQEAVRRSCAIKAGVVAEDETEQGRRALLNLGHTFGHALESETGFSDSLLHGEAVAIGMIMAFDLSHRLGLCPGQDAERVKAHFVQAGLPAGPDYVKGMRWDADALLAHMAGDKKAADGKLTFILTRGIGQAFIAADVAPEDVLGVVNEAVAA